MRRMVRTAAWLTLSVIAIGLGVPALCFYCTVYHAFNYVAAAIIAIVALLAAGGIGVVGIVLGPLGQESTGDSERRRLEMMRAHQRATLEELDEIIGVLEEIRDVLKEVEE
ncbi:hypothetical protein J7L60_01330 [Candidatus Bathyarchaeota archaeon]|nr:hypothetical protein [Candidatus Bathyarchaeota archaeon]